MKKLSRIITAILVTAATIGGSNAQPIASLPNQNGGVIVLRDEPCKSEGWMTATAFDDKTGYTGGCWTALGDHQVIVLWSPKPNTLFPVAYESSHFVKVRPD